ncbi:MAG: bifunctional DNA-formamidopyrimidine glycosylase/DNA-(apurinic or apyrimidinic site) lyase [Dehalococcoidales bacterium]|nr:bifunctional DNA-formamidopyrimidine glycosylase/DNA-(apurinic or apyrimidinic site) lyase [Dehalococcoidales bacterium]
MPELPEVETIKNELTPRIVGRRITDIEVFWEKMVRPLTAGEFRIRIVGQEVTGISRRGKYLRLHLSGGEMLVVHLRMSGSLLLDGASDNKYVNAIIRFDGTTIYFRDPRKFGVMWLAKDEAELDKKLGQEPLEKDFTPRLLADILRKRAAPIKALLLEQDLIAGVGNMYADEALFLAGIHPRRPGSSLTDAEIKRLHKAIQTVLRAGIANKGASIVNYYRPDGDVGSAHHEFKVAHRRGETCPKCGTPLVRITVRGRGTYFCPKCQLAA